MVIRPWNPEDAQWWEPVELRPISFTFAGNHHPSKLRITATPRSSLRESIGDGPPYTGATRKSAR